MHEVTQAQWQAVMGTTPWDVAKNVKEGDDYPASYVNWPDAVEFCRKLSEKEGLEYRLPTEAEWEYACRAGTTTAYSFGDDASELGEYAWYKENAWGAGQKHPHTVGQKKPNPWGLYDMHGNVWEWCSDWRGDYSSESVTDPAGPSSGSVRTVLLGIHAGRRTSSRIFATMPPTSCPSARCSPRKRLNRVSKSGADALNVRAMGAEFPRRIGVSEPRFMDSPSAAGQDAGGQLRDLHTQGEHLAPKRAPRQLPRGKAWPRPRPLMVYTVMLAPSPIAAVTLCFAERGPLFRLPR